MYLFSFSVFAQPLCERLQGGIFDYLSLRESRISFKNQGGLFNGGVCWWHNRLQRASAYLTDFKPDLPAPTKIELSRILKKLKAMNQVVEIPGHANFLSFSSAYQKEIQLTLEAWQREDGFINQQWIRGISGRYELPIDQMKSRMDSLYEQYQDSPQPIWIMAQIKGVESHAFLVLLMEPTDQGYKLQVIDSNSPQITKTFTYSYGQNFLKHPNDSYSFVPYLGFQKDFMSIDKGIRAYCGVGIGINLKYLPEGKVEVGD